MKLFYVTLLVLVFSCKSNNETKVPEKVIVEKTTFDAIHGNITDFKTITFPSKDGLTITADLYLVKEPKDFILLCHQADFSRGEYIEAAKKLNKLGYSCMAIDQRSGKIANNIPNETAKLAIEKGIKLKSYLEAKIDIEAAIDYFYKMNDNTPMIIVGSSYSASLSLLLAVNNTKIKAIAAFSPGEYLEGLNLANAILDLKKPVFVTSSKKEIEGVAVIIENVKSINKVHFKPEVKGIHGSRVLWKKTLGNEKYWKAFTNFLDSL